jgi:pimeloyl-ACP methyl ester carboxylesterase
MFQWITSLFIFYNGLNKSSYPTPKHSSTLATPKKDPWFFELYGIPYPIHYEQYATELNTSPIILIHGFGASSFHWRDNIPVLSKINPVYTMDLLGFGASDKPVDIHYTPEVWRNQTAAFVKKVYYANGCKPVVLVGNSIGGYTAIYAAVSPEISSMVGSVILLNPVGIFKGKELPFSSGWLKWVLQPAIFRWFFHYFQTNIRATLVSLYPRYPERVDDALIASILGPSEDPNAREVFCRILQAQLGDKHPYMDDLLSQMKKPFYLLVGKRDPWLIPTLYDDFMTHCPTAFGKWLDAGHCPHDEIPDEVNSLIITFVTLTEDPY